MEIDPQKVRARNFSSFVTCSQVEHQITSTPKEPGIFHLWSHSFKINDGIESILFHGG